MKKPPLLFFFVLALLSLLFGTAFFPWVRFITFAPLFAIVFQRKSLLHSLWIASLCGLLVDFFSYDFHFGVFCLCSLLTALATYHLRKYFFEESFHSIPLYTALISFVFSGIQFFLIHEHLSLDLKLVLSNLLFMPLVDALYGFVWFTCPGMVYSLLMPKRENNESH